MSELYLSGNILDDLTRVDAWPSITWSVLDYDRQPKLGFYTLQTAMQPILPSIASSAPARLDGRRWVYTSADDITIALWVVNDTLDEYPEAQLEWSVVDGDDQVIMSDIAHVKVQADGSQRVTVLHPSRLTQGIYRLFVELNDAQGQLLGQNVFEFVFVSKEQD